jgi:hypothetical protein
VPSIYTIYEERKSNYMLQSKEEGWIMPGSKGDKTKKGVAQRKGVRFVLDSKSDNVGDVGDVGDGYVIDNTGCRKDFFFQKNLKNSVMVF